ncbi:MAG: hypothetical protein HN742_35120 [Lentisphaerae bacterium]|nr:hypothetical protein [Lentisphaerota bacterium]MBT4819712.1 hypothetical protein [Lentisphaerota bacterium]MBT5609198.1 hypothetical protein [Lentisphaerota bacterium]MBT7055191.1 hypothetical protein [Lentisphaerota bacterium]MBT7847156.1 hypothetical protein [Lentisphaerota bacterium]
MDRERDVYHSTRPDGRFLSTLGFSHLRLRTGTPKLRFDPAMPVDELPEWRREVQTRLRALMTFPDVPPQPAPVKLWGEPRDGYELQKWETYPEPGSVVPLLMLVPNGVSVKRPAPAVLCFPGSASSKEVLAGEPELHPATHRKYPEHNKMAWHYAQAGLVAIAVENPGTAELADDITGSVGAQRNCLSVDLISDGRSYLGLSVFQKMHVLEWARTLPCVDADRVALSGHSLGTEPAMVMAAIDDRVSALVFNDFLCNCRQRIVVESVPGDTKRHWVGGLWHLVPGLLEWVDFPDILAAVAPRPLIITEGGVTAGLQRLQEAYTRLDAQESFEFHYYPKYADPASRRDGEEMPEGIPLEEYFEYANVDAPNHYFKEHLAVPWLTRMLKP